ncbi:SLATT domain-containing protein [Nocardiopsis sp. NPDC058631]|uniref:SLATT domain-containing protein n=1 Tax=Nocardiopsis sp. NPDC058631 TaxID=3346566 RepID=UPI0036482A54
MLSRDARLPDGGGRTALLNGNKVCSEGTTAKLGDEVSRSASNGDRELLFAQVREAYGRVTYTHKTHEKQADICSDLHRRQRRWKVVLTGVSSGAFLASLSGLLLSEQWAPLVTSFVAVLVSVLSLGDQAFKHGEQMQLHRDAAAKLWSVRESYLSLIVDLQSSDFTIEQGRASRDELQQVAGEIYGEAPRTTPKAYSRAQKALKISEDLTFAEEEIDLLIPVRLRSRNGGGDVAVQ